MFEQSEGFFLKVCILAHNFFNILLVLLFDGFVLCLNPFLLRIVNKLDGGMLRCKSQPKNNLSHEGLNNEKNTRKLCKEGLGAAIDAVVHLMDHRKVRPSTNILYCLLEGCTDKKNLALGRQVHRLIKRSGYIFDTFLGSHLIRMFAECGSLSEANQVFNELPDTTVYTWSALISAHAKHGRSEQAVKLFTQMHQCSGIKPNAYTLVATLKACASMPALLEGRLTHSYAVECGLESDVHLCNTLLDMYAKCHSLNNARFIFDRLVQRSLVTWNAMISGYAQHGHGSKALGLFKLMQQEREKPDKLTLMGALKACSNMKELYPDGRLVHVFVTEMGYDKDDFVQSTLIDMYTKCGDLAGAQNVFAKVQLELSVVTWNAMIAGYVYQGWAEEALRLFGLMQQTNLLPDIVTLMSVLRACAGLNAGDDGRLIHAIITESNYYESSVQLGNTLLDMYAKCGSVHDAHRLFKLLPKHDVVTWTAMIGAHICSGNGNEAVQLFNHMQEERVNPNEITFANVLKACSTIACVQQGKLAHAQIVSSYMESNALIGSALVDMYAKCGSIEDASKVFNNLSERSVVTWSSMFAGFAINRHYSLALKCFEDMQLEGLKPDSVTMVCLLSACNQMASMDQGCTHFGSVFEGHSAAPLVEHYTCMLDLLVQAGCPIEARSLFETMPSQSDTVGWMSFLRNCQRYGNIKLARGCFDHVVSL